MPKGGNAPPDQTRWVEVGVLGRPHGLKGEIYLRTPSGQDDVILNATRLKIHTKKIERVLEILEIRMVKSGFLVTLEGVDDRDAAARLTGAAVLLDRAEFPEPEVDEFYYSDLEGAPVMDRDGQVLGRVLYFEEYGTDVMFFEWTGHGKVAIPVVEAYVVRIDTDPPGVTIETANLEDLLQN